MPQCTSSSKCNYFFIYLLFSFKYLTERFFNIPQEYPPGSVLVYLCGLFIRCGQNIVRVLKSLQPKTYVTSRFCFEWSAAMDTHQTDHHFYSDLLFSYLEPQIQSLPVVKWCFPGLWVFLKVLTSCNVSPCVFQIFLFVCTSLFHNNYNKNRQKLDHPRPKF